MNGFSDQRILQYVTEVKETSDIKEVAQLLSTGEWIAICATTVEPSVFVLGNTGISRNT